MTTQKNHPAAGQPDSFDRYPGYYGSDLELTYTPQRSVFTLWAITVYLVREKKGHYFYVTYFPAIFMTAVCTTYICIAPEGFGLGPQMALTIAILSVVVAAFWFNIWYFKTTKKLW